MNVLVIAPHPDDEAIGCGGTIRLHFERKDRVCVVFLTSGEAGLKHLPREQAWSVREREAASAAERLGIASTRFFRQPDWTLGATISPTAALLSAVLRTECPETIYLPHEREWHPDHQAVPPIVRAALDAGYDLKPKLLAYEVWTPIQEYDHVEDVTLTMARKLQAVRCYRSQLAGFRYDRAVRGLAQYRGALTLRCRFAEVFRAVSPLHAPSPRT